ncbi:DoxX family protein [Nocardia goodfellowii]|uniref:Zn-dependent protease with chaperone function n=1 Tax=Nocardia goodfellowii TaxID=882446 RepID=A0ABS4QMS6_9NOCA|nr:DoxX family protein [Nocardia goodfellowii]MBP2193012.1 Zn-dependent protease with chaperone function [Nocardia goodfellowii]
MFIATVVVSILLAAFLSVSATFKVTRNPQVVASMTKAGVPDSWLNPLAAVLLAGAVGLVAGLWWAPIGVAAAVGLVLYFVAACGFHIKDKDWKNLPTPVVVLLLAVAALVLRLLTM